LKGFVGWVCPKGIKDAHGYIDKETIDRWARRNPTFAVTDLFRCFEGGTT
jgi:hypothetical protein